MLVITSRRTSHPENGMSSPSPPPTGFPISQRLIEHHAQHPGWESESRNGHSFVPAGTGGYNEHLKEQMMIRSRSGWSGGAQAPGSCIWACAQLVFFLTWTHVVSGLLSWDAHTSAFQAGRRWARSLFFLKSFFLPWKVFFSLSFFGLSLFLFHFCVFAFWEVAPLTSLSASLASPGSHIRTPITGKGGGGDGTWRAQVLGFLPQDWEWDVRSSVRNWDWLTGKEERSLLVGKE